MDLENIININDANYEEWNLGDKYQGEAAEVAKSMGTEKLGFHLEILHSGKFSCPYHFHHSEEELFLVLDGKAILRQNNEYRELKKGDLVYFSPDEKGAHQFYNHTDADF
ncbi:MAG: cupin domain-containing protein [Candidatus Marinimicrobia bacterium]|nr:cupin domain-containing protein [Candidatus Neomarinimicrobiota bacterium]